MEPEDLHSDLEALRELYGLLHWSEAACNVVVSYLQNSNLGCDCDDSGHCRNLCLHHCGGEVTSNLSERSKFLLKNLLDGATKRVLETHKRMIAAAEHGICGSSCYSESGKGRGLLELRPSVPLNRLQATPTPEVIRNFDPAFSSSKDEDSPNQLTTQEVISQLSRLTFSFDGPENRKKNCEFNKKNSIKPHDTDMIMSKGAKQQGRRCDPLGYFYQASGDAKKSFDKNETNKKLLKMNETMRQGSICGLRQAPGVDRSVASSSNSVASGDNAANLDEMEGETVNNLSKDIDEVVEHIEYHISALHLCSKLADATKAALPHDLHTMPTSQCPMVQAKEHLVKNNELSHAVDPVPDRDDLQIGRSKNGFFNYILSKSRRSQHKEMDQTCKHVVRSDSRVNKKVANWNVFGMLETDSQKQNETTGCYVHGFRIPTKPGDITKRSPMPVKLPYPTPIDSRGKESSPNMEKWRRSVPSKLTVSKSLSHKKRPVHEILTEQKKAGTGILRNKILLKQQESDESSTAGSGSSDSEAYSLASEDSSASISSSFDHGVRDESSSSTSSDCRDGGESGRLYDTRTHKSIHPTNSEPEKGEGQRPGRMRRLKNKLALIFHHHHHHHHHHRYDNHDRGDHSQGEHTKPLWTSLHKLFHPRTGNKVGEDKLRKAGTRNVLVKHQVGHFHSLVGGLMRHLKQSKKAKTPKGGMGRLGNDQTKKARKAKQLHWWQMFHRQGGVKLPKKRRVKVGFKGKKNQLKVPKLK
ncbi:Detected protein of unknown function [Hibiscus syriacus]|uniref:Uncharacterized protein n=1 Tax=Hibiscus syriacus TaxID=106335 RepID=A0A6A3CDX6_HIBSY|nr:Detected protein of unknown function [Hibiscus syriacus]